jgi:hypothetical protein
MQLTMSSRKQVQAMQVQTMVLRLPVVILAQMPGKP